MAKLTIRDGKYLVGNREIVAGMAIRRYDAAAPGWFTGTVETISIYDFTQGKYVPCLALVVEGYAPSPLNAGSKIEIVSTV